MKVFLDANILFSAAWHDGAIRALLNLLIGDGHTLVVDAYVIAEADRNLRIHRPSAIADLDNILHRSQTSPSTGHPDEAVMELGLPPGDQHVLSTAVHAECDVLITGDRRHFGRLFKKRVGNVLILTPAQAFDHLLSNSNE